MPKTSDQKMKLVHLLNFLNEDSDELHTVTMAQIIEYLARNGVQAERKSIYSDIEALQQLGYDIVYTKESPAGYFMGHRKFETAELKLLVDAVQSSKFITERKSYDLIKKLETLTSHYEAKKLQRQVYVNDRVKADNEKILYNVDLIHEAINLDVKIQFQYCEWNQDKKLVPKYDGKRYEAEPVMLMWEDENYYLVAYENQSDKIKHYRVDKMTATEVTSKTREAKELIRGFNPAEYSKEHFGMYAGREESVSLLCSPGLIGVMIDRFGRNVTLMKTQEDRITVRVKVQVSPQFFGWVAGLCGQVRIASPERVQEEYLDFLKKNIDSQKE